MQDHILSAEELELVTGKLKPGAQRRALTAMRIPFGVRLDGFPLVAWSSVAAFTGAPKPLAEPPIPMGTINLAGITPRRRQSPAKAKQ